MRIYWLFVGFYDEVSDQDDLDISFTLIRTLLFGFAVPEYSYIFLLCKFYLI